MTYRATQTVHTPRGPIREYGPETILSDHATRFMISQLHVPDGAWAAEPGCGTGILSLYMAVAGAARVVGTDVDGDAIKAACYNAAANRVINVEFLEGNLLEPVMGNLDLVVALLPHKPGPRPFNARYYGGADGTDLLISLIHQASDRLRQGGTFYLYLNSIANPGRVMETFTQTFDVSLCAEKTRRFTREEFNTLTPRLFDYLCQLRRQGLADFWEDCTGPYFMARIYRGVRR